MSAPRWDVFDYREPGKASPIRTWLIGLSETDRALVEAKILIVRTLALSDFKLPLVRPLGGGLFELRPSRYRILWCFGPRRRQFTLLHAFPKTTRATPPGDRAMAEARKQKLEEDASHATKHRFD